MLMTFAPFFSHAAVPMRVKAGLTLALTVLLFPVCAQPSLPPLTRANAGQMVLVEATAVPGAGAERAVRVPKSGTDGGQILGIQMGFSLVQLLTRRRWLDTTVLALFSKCSPARVLATRRSDHWCCAGWREVSSYLPAVRRGCTSDRHGRFAGPAAGYGLAGLQIAAPVLFATLLAEFWRWAFFGKISPQLPVLLLGSPSRAGWGDGGG